MERIEPSEELVTVRELLDFCGPPGPDTDADAICGGGNMGGAGGGGGGGRCEGGEGGMNVSAGEPGAN